MKFKFEGLATVDYALFQRSNQNGLHKNIHITYPFQKNLEAVLEIRHLPYFQGAYIGGRAYIWRDICVSDSGGFIFGGLIFGGLIFEGAYIRDFTVYRLV